MHSAGFSMRPTHFAFWAQAAQMAWLPWLEAARTMMLPWSTAAKTPELDRRDERAAS
jgi:hypothetical protein